MNCFFLCDVSDWCFHKVNKHPAIISAFQFTCVLSVKINFVKTFRLQRQLLTQLIPFDGKINKNFSAATMSRAESYERFSFRLSFRFHLPLPPLYPLGCRRKKNETESIWLIWPSLSLSLCLFTQLEYFLPQIVWRWHFPGKILVSFALVSQNHFLVSNKPLYGHINRSIVHAVLFSLWQNLSAL